MAAKKATVNSGVKSKTAEAAAKVEAPETTSVKAEDKATTPEEPAKADEKKAKPTAAKKETVKKETVKKETVKKTSAGRASAKKETVKKETAKKAEPETELYVQFADQSLTQAELVKRAKDVWEYELNQKADDLQSIELYVKPEERRTYYVMNKDFTGSFGI